MTATATSPVRSFASPGNAVTPFARSPSCAANAGHAAYRVTPRKRRGTLLVGLTLAIALVSAAVWMTASPAATALEQATTRR